MSTPVKQWSLESVRTENGVCVYCFYFEGHSELCVGRLFEESQARLVALEKQVHSLVQMVGPLVEPTNQPDIWKACTPKENL